MGDSSKAFKKLGWEPKTTLEELVEEMVAFDKEEASKESFLNKEGFKVHSSIESVPFNQ